MGAERERLRHVVSHEHDGLAHVLLDAAELAVNLRARDRIERAKRLVHQQDWRIGGERAGDAHALTLPAGKLVRPPRRKRGRVESNQLEQLADARRDPAFVPAQESRHRRDVLRDAQVWKQSDFLHDVARAAAELERVPLRVLRDSTSTSPESGSSSRLISLRMVLLPAPLRPTSASVSPAAMSSVNPRRTGTLPRERCTSLKRIALLLSTLGHGSTVSQVAPGTLRACALRVAMLRRSCDGSQPLGKSSCEEGDTHPVPCREAVGHAARSEIRHAAAVRRAAGPSTSRPRDATTRGRRKAEMNDWRTANCELRLKKDRRSIRRWSEPFASCQSRQRRHYASEILDVGAHADAVRPLPEPVVQAAAEVEFVARVRHLILFVQVPQVSGAAQQKWNPPAAAKRCPVKWNSTDPSTTNRVSVSVAVMSGADSASPVNRADRSGRDTQHAPFDRHRSRQIDAELSLQAWRPIQCVSHSETARTDRSRFRDCASLPPARFRGRNRATRPRLRRVRRCRREECRDRCRPARSPMRARRTMRP